MIWVFVAIAAVIVAVVARYTVATVSARLANTEAVATYDLSAATEFVHRALPTEVAERMGRASVALLLAWNLDQLRRKGVAAFGEADSMSGGFTRTPSRTEPDEALDEVLRRAAVEGIDVDAVDAVIVLELNAQYLASIGAVGEQAEDV
ncbi:MAG: hypothetical protein OXI26_14500 [bacterium]|nr:hypothetical protein [bacterium]